MDKSYETIYHQEEEFNWWFVSRRNAILKLLRNTPKSHSILDIGCAGGPLLLDLQENNFTACTGLDFSAEAVSKCKSRGLTAFQMDAHDLKFPSNHFNLLIASDSLEHLEHDSRALSNWHDKLSPGGKLLVFVPAYQFLWSHHDEVNHHFRRYTKSELCSKLKAAGFEVNTSGYWNFMLFFPTFIFRIFSVLKNKIIPSKPKDQLSGLNPFLNKILIAWMKLENNIFTHLKFPFGVSVFAEATKPAKPAILK